MASSEVAVTPAAARPRRFNAAQAVALLVWLFSVALSLATIWIVLVTLDRPAPDQYAFRGFEATLALPWGLVGGLIAVRRPRHRLGWLLLAVAVLAGIQGVVDQYPVLALAGRAPAESAVGIRWLSSWEWVLGMSGLLVFMPLIFPDGHLLSARWRPVLVLSIVAVAGVAAVTGAVTQPVGPYPLTRDVSSLFAANPLLAVPYVLFILSAALAVGSLVLRFGRSQGDQRQQIKWVAYGGVLGALGLGLDFAPNSVAQAIGSSTAFLGAGFVGIAILRYRLYEIDLLINRTFVYGTLTAILAGVYTASIALTTRLFSAITGERSDAAVVLTTLIVVSLFTPLKSRLQSIVDKRLKAPHSGMAAALSGEMVPAVTAEQLRALHAEWHRSADERP
jgi:hypothetical protein